MKLLSFAYLVLFVSFSMYAQKHVFVYDAERLEPIPFAEVTDSLGNQFLTNWDGRVDVEYLQVLKVHALGFMDTLRMADTIFLTPSRNPIPEVMVYGGELEADTVFGNPSEEDRIPIGIGISNNRMFCYGLVVHLSLPTIVSAVRFYVPRTSKRHAPYRLRLFSVDLDEDSIVASTELIDSSMIGEISCRRCWETIELQSPLLVKGSLMLALEYLPDFDYSGDGDDMNELYPCMTESGTLCTTYIGVSKDGQMIWKRQCLSMFEHLVGKNLNLAIYIEGKVLD